MTTKQHLETFSCRLLCDVVSSVGLLSNCLLFCILIPSSIRPSVTVWRVLFTLSVMCSRRSPDDFPSVSSIQAILSLGLVVVQLNFSLSYFCHYCHSSWVKTCHKSVRVGLSLLGVSEVLQWNLCHVLVLYLFRLNLILLPHTQLVWLAQFKVDALARYPWTSCPAWPLGCILDACLLTAIQRLAYSHPKFSHHTNILCLYSLDIV